MDERLNESRDAMFAGGGQQQKDVVSKEHGKDNADIAVNDVIGIEMKRDLSNSQRKKLEGQINSYLRDYEYVIVCSCGIKDKDGWRELQNNYKGRQGGLSDPQKEVVFVWKKKENSGSDQGGGNRAGGDDPLSVGRFF